MEVPPSAPDTEQQRDPAVLKKIKGKRDKENNSAAFQQGGFVSRLTRRDFCQGPPLNTFSKLKAFSW